MKTHPTTKYPVSVWFFLVLSGIFASAGPANSDTLRYPACKPSKISKYQNLIVSN